MTLPAWVGDMITLWHQCRDHETGRLAYLPDAGGMVDQSPFVLDCFAILEQAQADWTSARKGVE